MKDLALFMNGCSVAEIKGGEFFILAKGSDGGLNKTDLQGFKKCLEDFKDVCENTWNNELKEDYKKICEAVGM